MKQILFILSLLFLSGCNEDRKAFRSNMDMLEGVNIALTCHGKSDFSDCVEILIAKELILQYGRQPDIKKE